MCPHYSHMEIGVLEVHTGHPLMWAHGYHDGLQNLELERSLVDTEVEVLQVQDGYQEVCAVEPTPLLV